MLYDRLPVGGNSLRSVKTTSEVRVGVDAGGTFTDVVVLDGGLAQSLKLPTDAGLSEGLARARRLVTGTPTVVAGTTWVTIVCPKRRSSARREAAATRCCAESR